MVEIMDRHDDVERLFSWIKTPDLHYREFAGEREVADAAATWPALRDAVPEPSPSDKHLQPEGSYEDELLPPERARHLDHPAAVFGRYEAHPPAHQPLPSPAVHEAEAAGEVPWADDPAPTVAVPREPPPETILVQREPPPVAAPSQPAPSLPPQAVVQTPPAGGEYRGFEEVQPAPPIQPAPLVQPAPPAAQPAAQPVAGQAEKPRSLDAIFSRVAHQGSVPRDGQRPAPRGATGLGPVFRRLR